jgi:hypothetical protein
MLDSDIDAVMRSARSLESVDEFAPAFVRRAHEADAHA